MANIKSSQKDVRRILKRTEHNRQVKSRLKTLRKKFLSAVAEGDSAQTKDAARSLISAMDKAAKRSIIHKNRVDAMKSVCGKYLAAS